MSESIGSCQRMARKEHRCWWCTEPIRKGELYNRWAWVDGGDIIEIKCHEECNWAWDRVSRTYHGGYECDPQEHVRGETTRLDER